MVSPIDSQDLLRKIDIFLGWISPAVCPFITITKENKESGDYIQCAGSKQRITVELRLHGTQGSFVHYVLGKGHLKKIERDIKCSIGPIKVDASQVLKIEDARELFYHFMEHTAIHPNYTASDITNMFLNS